MFEGIVLRRQPRMMNLVLGTSLGYAFGGHGASNLSGEMLSRKIDYDILLCNERLQVARTMNMSGYGNEFIGRANMHNKERV